MRKRKIANLSETEYHRRMGFLSFIHAHLPWFWLAITILCVVIEVFTFTLTTIWFAFGACVLIFVSFAPIPFKWQLLLFLLISLLLLIFTRPFALKKLKIKKIPTNSDSLVGKKVLVTEKITEFQKGSVKLNGVVWSAKSEDGTVIEKGSECVVTSIEGATALVKKV